MHAERITGAGRLALPGSGSRRSVALAVLVGAAALAGGALHVELAGGAVRQERRSLAVLFHAAPALARNAVAVEHARASIGTRCCRGPAGHGQAHDDEGQCDDERSHNHALLVAPDQVRLLSTSPAKSRENAPVTAR